VIGFFHDDSPGLRARLRKALDAGDASLVQITAHSLKGLVSNFDAERAVKAALRVEQMGHAGRLNDAPAAIDDLDRELDELAVSLDAEAARLG
jgi:HPt (histidine-containing phosphotransfer) domain-containing protein